MNTIGARIKKRRKELGISQLELANRVGYASDVSIVNLENGKRKLPQTKILIFATALHVDPAYLIGYDTGKREELTEVEQKVVDAYRKTDSVTQKCVRKLLDITT